MLFGAANILANVDFGIKDSGNLLCPFASAGRISQSISKAMGLRYIRSPEFHHTNYQCCIHPNINLNHHFCPLSSSVRDSGNAMQLKILRKTHKWK